MNESNAEYLRLLSIGYYVVAALTAVCACFPIIHLVVGLFVMFSPEEQIDALPLPKEVFGAMVAGIALVFIFLGWMLAIANVIAGWSLARSRNYVYCFIVGVLNCVGTPLNMALGICTLILLTRPDVKVHFQRNPFSPEST